ncbi:MAG: hypothetical protein U0452_06380 [Anaerolineae bacterium]
MADSGPGSLRQVVVNAPVGSTISFGVSGMITLTSGPIGLDKDLIINGSNPYQVTISGNNAGRMFKISGAGTDIAIYGIRVINGFAGGGDGVPIYVNPGTTLNLQYSVLENNTAGTSTCCGKGGAIFVDNANVIIFNSSLRNNTAGTDSSNNYGGAITLYNGGSVAVTQSCLTGNTDPIWQRDPELHGERYQRHQQLVGRRGWAGLKWGQHHKRLGDHNTLLGHACFERGGLLKQGFIQGRFLNRPCSPNLT